MDHGQTMDGDEYRNQLNSANMAHAENRKLRRKKRPLFLQDNSRPQTAFATMQLLTNLGWQVLHHPPYSPDLAPSDYFLFSELKRYLRGKVYNGKDDLESDICTFFDSKPPDWYR